MKERSNQEYQQAEQYWARKLSGALSEVNLAPSRQRSLAPQEEYLEVAFDQELATKLFNISKNKDTILYVFLLAVGKILIAKYTGQKDIIIGSPLYWPQPEAVDLDAKNQYLPLRDLLDEEMTVKELLAQVNQTLRDGYLNQFYPLVKLFSGREPKADSPNLSKVIFALENIHPEITFEPSRNELAFSLAKNEAGLRGKIIYNGFLFTKERIQKIFADYVTVLEQVLANLQLKLGEVSLVTAGAQPQWLVAVNNTQTNYPEKTLAELFEDQVEQTPDQIAVVFGSKQLTYQELNQKANQLARLLREHGAGPELIVGLMVDSSLEMAIGILGILKSGGAYLPLAPDYPPERIAFMIKDSQIPILVTDRADVTELAFEGSIINFPNPALSQQEVTNLSKINQSNNLAYVIYTSGTTGKPKGVLIEQQNITNTIWWRKQEYGLTSNDKILQLFSYVFDGFLTSFFTPLTSGAQVILLDGAGAKDLLAIKQQIIKQQITHFISVPSLYQALLELMSPGDLASLIMVTLAGEQFSHGLIKSSQALNSNLEIINEYGPTESAVVATYQREVASDQVISIGRPISNTRVYIIDEAGQLAGPEGKGELCIAGKGLARGYLNEPELTKRKFVVNPFAPNERMYPTGDLVQWLPEGKLRFLGRIDTQVKIRGFRIELGEIENRLLDYESIKEAVVVDKESAGGNRYLAAYLVAQREVSSSVLKDYLLQKLPEYMVPAYFAFLPQLPLTPNGKIHRQALKELAESQTTESIYEDPGNHLEETLVNIWQKVLGVTNIEVNDNFFTRGGNSLKLVIMAAEIHKALHVEIPMGDLFEQATIRKLARYIAGVTESSYSAISPVAERAFYPVSSAQKRLYILNQLEGIGISYNMPMALSITGNLVKEELEQLFNQLIQRHEGLRTSFQLIDGEPVQIVHQGIELRVADQVADATNLNDMTNAFIRPFDLSHAPLFRVGLIRLTEAEQILIFDMHHIISDAISMNILIRELNSLRAGKSLPRQRLQYKDFSHWQQELFQSEVIQKQEAYWLELFQEVPPPLNLPTDYPRPKVQSFAGALQEFAVGTELTARLRELARRTQTTLYMLLLAVYNLLLYRYTGQEDLVVGSPVAGRTHGDLANIIGIFINMLALRNYPAGYQTFREFLLQVKKNALKAYENQDYQFEELIQKLDLARDLSRSPLFETIFVFQNVEISDLAQGDLQITPYELENRVAKFDLSLIAEEANDQLNFSLEYCTKLYQPETMHRLASHFVNVLERVASNPDLKLAEVDLLSEAEKRDLLVNFNDTQADYPQEKTICELFEEQVAKTPENIAVVFQEAELTYLALNRKANQLARLLRSKGVRAESLVGIMVERSAWMIVAVLGVLKAGGAYLPIDPKYPQERIQYMVADSQMRLLLTQGQFLNESNFNIELINIENEQSYYHQDETDLEKITKSSNLVYVIYTSGTTGKPKGVMLENRSFVNISFAWRRKYHLDQWQVRLLQVASFSFDVFGADFSRALLNGGQLVICPGEVKLEPIALYSLIKKYQINMLDLTPALLIPLMNYIDENQLDLSNLKLLMVGSDSCPAQGFKEIVARWGTTIRIVNCYGITETAIDSSSYEEAWDRIPTWGNLSIGKPLQNTQFYILNDRFQLQPIGISGELFIGGAGLARGYFNNPEITAEKFIVNPFIPGEKLYRTGDLARWLPDGNLEFLGRSDHQVKIRGFRIELGEIESRLLRYETVREVVVVDKVDASGQRLLAAYLVSDTPLTVASLKEYLLQELPEYMIPAEFSQLAQLPQTSNGKIDRQKLKSLTSNMDLGSAYEAPRNQLEKRLAAIWQQVLGKEKIGINDNFFLMGGHSLKVITLTTKIYKEFQIVVQVGEIFNLATIKEQARYLKQRENASYLAIEPTEAQEYYPLSAAQKRLYTVAQLQGENTNYNMPMVIIIKELVDQARLEAAFNQLIQRHEVFRTSFSLREGQPMQQVDPEVNLEFGYFEASETELDTLIDKFIRAFDLSQAPLLRVGLIKLATQKFALMFDMHHIISDGISIEILIDELLSLYEKRDLPRLQLQYKDYAVWQNQFLKSEFIKKQEEYWLQVFTGEIPDLKLPTDFERPQVQRYDGASVNFGLDGDLTAALKNFALKQETTLFVIFLAVYNILLGKYSGQTDIVVGSPVAGRDHPDLEQLIGMFVNMVTLRNQFSKEMKFVEFLGEVKANTIKALDHSQYQFEDLVTQLKVKRDLGRNPLFNVELVFQEEGQLEKELLKSRFDFYPINQVAAKFELSLFAAEEEGGILLTLRYAKSLYRETTAKKFLEHVVEILKQILANPEIKIGEISVTNEFIQLTGTTAANEYEADFGF